MAWQPMPPPPSDPSGTRGTVVRAAAAEVGRRAGGSTSSGSARRRRRLSSTPVAQHRAQRPGSAPAVSSPPAAPAAARRRPAYRAPRARRPAVEGVADLGLDEGRLVLDDEDWSSAGGEPAHHLGAERVGHADPQQPDACAVQVGIVQAEIEQGLADAVVSRCRPRRCRATRRTGRPRWRRSGWRRGSAHTSPTGGRTGPPRRSSAVRRGGHRALPVAHGRPSHSTRGT